MRAATVPPPSSRDVPRYLRALAIVAIGVATATQVRAADLIVSGAASLTNAFRELAPIFEAQAPGTRLLLNFASSDALLAQIAKGAPADVFAAADQESMDRAEAQKLLVAGTRRDFVGNALVLATPAPDGLGLKALADLQRPEVTRIALGAPASVPAGRYAKGALEAARLWTAVEPKAVYAQSVRQALDYLARGEVDAGFVYATDAALMKDKVAVVAVVPTSIPIRYPVAAVAGSPNPADALRFVGFLQTPAAQAVFARHGFTRP